MNINTMLEISRETMEELIEIKKGNLLDPAVITASQNLDRLINKYNEVFLSE